MRRILGWLFLLALVAGALAVVSYAGARATAGKLLGSNPPVSDRSIVFAYEGVPELPGKPRAWVIKYGRTQLPGVPRVAIYVSMTGKLITTRPADLDQRLEAWERNQELR
jgi:hypothetical protein